MSVTLLVLFHVQLLRDEQNYALATEFEVSYSRNILHSVNYLKSGKTKYTERKYYKPRISEIWEKTKYYELFVVTFFTASL